MVISALRYTFADTDDSYDEYLRPVVVDMLKTMLNEQDLENRRLALITLNSATHNKPELVLPYLDEFLPLVMNETYIKPELVREVSMGPFKHKVDDGLEIRKVSYLHSPKNGNVLGANVLYRVRMKRCMLCLTLHSTD